MAEKTTFFTELFKLDEDEDEIEDLNDAAVILRQFQTPCQPVHRTRSAGFAGNISEPLPENSPMAVSPSSIQSSSKTVRRSPKLIRSSPAHHTEVVDSVNTTLKRRGKRKRDSSLESIPTAAQIFKGLVFYFIPNNDIAPARRFRIKKAVERGALWVREWRPDVTHVIADKSLTYKDVLSFLKLGSLPQGVALVTEDYPAACISYRLVLNPNQVIYSVEGFEQPTRSGCSTCSEKIEAALPARFLDSEFPSSKGSSKVAPPDADLEFPYVSSQCSPATGQGKSTANGRITGDRAEPKQTSRNALDEMIEELKAYKDLPLDYDEDVEFVGTKTNEAEEEEQSADDKLDAHVKSKMPGKQWQQGFSCMHKHDGRENTQNPNLRTVEILQQMLDYYSRINDHWRTIAYRKAISALRKHSTKVMTKEEAFHIPFIGQRLAAKIEEIVWTDRLRRLENTNFEPNDLALQNFLKIYGVGFSQAIKWINQGHRTLSDLVSKAQLTKNQLIGIERYDDFQTRIPRKEVESHGKFFRDIVHQVDPSIQVTIGGSYRRGATDSGDIDLIISKPDCGIRILHTIIFDTVLRLLQERGYTKVSLAASSKDDGSKWHGAAALPEFGPVWRRVDLLLVPWDEMGATLIYFTGNDIFNRSIRLLARKKGLRLNQHGLWRDVIGGARSGGGRSTRGTLIEGKSEDRIFELLGVPYRPPEHRNC